LADSLVAAYLHDLAALKAACYELVKKNLAAVTLSPSIMNLKTSQPAIWKQLRVALGLPEEDEEEEEEEEDEEEEEEEEDDDEEGPQRKSARRET